MEFAIKNRMLVSKILCLNVSNITEIVPRWISPKTHHGTFKQPSKALSKALLLSISFVYANHLWHMLSIHIEGRTECFSYSSSAMQRHALRLHVHQGFGHSRQWGSIGHCLFIPLSALFKWSVILYINGYILLSPMMTLTYKKEKKILLLSVWTSLSSNGLWPVALFWCRWTIFFI